MLKHQNALKENSDVLVVIGIGGSYLGARAAIEMLTSSFRNSNEYPEIVFVGNHLSSTYTKELVDYLADKDFSVNVISKSGTTTEPAVAFRLFKQLVEERYGKKKHKNVYLQQRIKKRCFKTVGYKRRL